MDAAAAPRLCPHAPIGAHRTFESAVAPRRPYPQSPSRQFGWLALQQSRPEWSRPPCAYRSPGRSSRHRHSRCAWVGREQPAMPTRSAKTVRVDRIGFILELPLQLQAEDLAAAGDGAAVLLVVGDEGYPTAAWLPDQIVGGDAVAVDDVLRCLESDEVLEVVLVAVHDVHLLGQKAEQ